MWRTFGSCMVVFLIGCGDAAVMTTGQASFVRPANEGGRSVPPQEDQEALEVTFSLQGAGDFTPVQSALCSLTSGEFSQIVQASGRVDSNGRYVSSYANESASGSISNPLCGTVRDLRIENVTRFTLSASIPTTERNCDGYCQARAELQCEAAQDRAACITSVAATCNALCRQASRITGTGSASASALAAVNGSLGSRGTVEAEVDLVFTAFE